MTQRVDPNAAMKMATDIVIAFLTTRSIEPGDLPALVREVQAALLSGHALLPAEGQHPAALAEAPIDARPRPAVPIDQSVTDDHIVSLEDGKTYRSLRRHLMSRYGMTPDDYRRKWGLPPDYPMVAPSYARDRATVAKRIGLGKGKANPRTMAAGKAAAGTSKARARGSRK